MNYLKSIFSPPSALELAAKKLAEHQRQLLSVMEAREYATRMVEYHTSCIVNLEVTVKEQTR